MHSLSFQAFAVHHKGKVFFKTNDWATLLLLHPSILTGHTETPDIGDKNSSLQRFSIDFSKNDFKSNNHQTEAFGSNLL